MPILLISALLACFDSPEAPAPAAPGPAKPQAAGPSTAPAAPVASKADTLPDLLQGLVEDQCENGPGAEGADAYFYGTWTFAGDQLSGEERWVLFANPKWEAKGGKDCAIRWDLSGTKGPAPVTCPSCAYSVSFKAEPNLGTSDCPQEMLTGRRSPTGEMVGGEATPFEQTYGVKIKGERAEVVFAKSGKKLGEGYANAEALVWLSDHSCKWF